MKNVFCWNNLLLLYVNKMQSTTEINNDASTKVKKTKTKKTKTESESTESTETQNATQKDIIPPAQEASTKKEDIPEQTVTEDAAVSSEDDSAEKLEEFSQQIDKIEKLIEDIAAFNKNSKEFKFESKEIITKMCGISKNLTKEASSLSNNLTATLLKEAVASLKSKGSKKNKKDKAPKDKKNFAVNQEFAPLPYVLKFMELPADSLVSKGMIIQKVNSFVKTEKNAKNPEIFVEGNNRKFKVIGDLKKFFSDVHKVMKDRKATAEGEAFPTELAYTDIMKYLKYCFPEAAPK